MFLAEPIFWMCLLLMAFTYLMYPVIVLVMVKCYRRNNKPAEKSCLPSVTVVVSVFNEARVLHQKLENLRLADYPAEKITFLLGSDGSTDETGVILQRSAFPGVSFTLFPDRRGKASVINDLVSMAKGEIIVFSDANTMFCRDTIQKLVRHFTDPRIGAVSGELRISTNQNAVASLGETSYWDYENILKSLESRFYSTLGATGGVYAIRKNLYKPLPIRKAVTDDLLIPLNILKFGYRVKYDREALAYEEGEGSVTDEFRRKVRIGAQNFSTISEVASLLHPRYGFVSFALWSHKIIRWCVPFLLIGAAISCTQLALVNSYYATCLVIGFVFLCIALAGYLLERLCINIGPLSLPYYFLAMNVALFVGFVRFLLGRQRPTWDVVRDRGNV